MRDFLRAAACSLAVSVAGCAGDNATNPSPAAQIVEAGWSFGFCVGACRGQLLLDVSELEYRIWNRTGEQVLVDNRGQLTGQGAARLSILVEALPEALRESYGCPDCADAGAAYIVRVRGSGTENAAYEYPNPPPELAAIDAFLKEVMNALGRCEATPDVMLGEGCSPLPS